MFYYETLKDQMNQITLDVKKIILLDFNLSDIIDKEKNNFFLQNIYKYASDRIKIPKSRSSNPRSDQEHDNPPRN